MPKKNSNKKRECYYCGYLEGKRINVDDIIENFEVIALSNPVNQIIIPYGGECTSLLKCPECHSYYLMNIRNSINDSGDVVTIKKYSPKVDEKTLIRTVEGLEGIVSSRDIDGYSLLQSKIRKILKENRNQIGYESFN